MKRQLVWGMNNRQVMYLAIFAGAFFVCTVLTRVAIWWRCASCTLAW